MRFLGYKVAVSLAVVASLLATLPAGTSAGTRKDRAPTPEPNFAVNLAPRPCAFEGNDPYERKVYRGEGWKAPDYVRYPGACTRLRFSYGPILVKPGQNDVLVTPVTIEKPSMDGYVTRFRPNLVRADGTVPPVEQVHLHHGTWISAPEYGTGPFFASGEEKTVAPFPRGYGMPVKSTDQWLLLYMVHSAVPNPMEAYIIYDVDFIPKAQGDKLGIKPAYPIWLDVRPSSYPVFNVQRQYGGRAGRCTWPRQRCAGFDPWGKTIVGQGEPGNGKGTDLKLPARGNSFSPGSKFGPFTGGTFIGMGGHLHPGGIQNEVNVVRKSKSRRIYTGVAAYWKSGHKARWGGPPTSWDYSMRVVGLPFWGVHVKPGDILRTNATYDTRIQSSYENMGIEVGLMVPDKNGKPQAPGVDPFRAKIDRSMGCKSGGLKHGYLCDKGWVTHGPMAENSNHSAAFGKWSAKKGGPTNGVTIANFLYTPGDLSTRFSMGIPTVKLGSQLRFTNVEGALIYHTVTSCRFPCLGPTGAAFPLADGSASDGRKLDFDSSEVGLGTPAIGPAKQTLNWDLPVTRETGYKPGEVVTYYCRIHPFMRGAFEVTQ